MKRITKTLLRRLKACPEQVETFAKLFPRGAEVTEENALKADKAGLDVNWLAYKVLTFPAWEQYQAAIAQAWKQLEAVTAPALEQYEAAKAPAWKQYEAATATALGQYEAAIAVAFVRAYNQPEAE